MKYLLLRTLLVALTLTPPVFAAAATKGDPAGIVAKARAYYGSEAALNSIKSIHMVGKLETNFDSEAKDSKVVLSDVEIVYQKPYRQKVTATNEQGTEITALDGFDAWHRIEDKSNPPRWNMTLQKTEDIKRLRANAQENLMFYKGVDIANVDDLGTVTMNGVICHKIAVRYDTNNIFFRYIDQVTGRLVMTETLQGGTVKEDGQMVVDGIRWPTKSVTTIKTGDGKIATITVTFTKITLNEVFPDSYFAIPSILQK